MNTGTVQDNGIGGFAGAKFVNAAGAHFAFTSDGTTLTADATPGNLFSNLGTLIKSGGTGLGVSEIDASVNSTGLIEVDTGTLTLAGGGSIAGTVSGAGTLLLINGSYGVGNATGTGHVVFGAGASVGFLVNELVATPFTFDDNVAVSVAGRRHRHPVRPRHHRGRHGRRGAGGTRDTDHDGHHHDQRRRRQHGGHRRAGRHHLDRRQHRHGERRRPRL